MKGARYWGGWCAAVCAVALAGQPPPAAPPPTGLRAVAPGAPGDSAARAATPGGTAPDDEFIEFLGADDVDDAAWAEFLKNSAQRKVPPSASRPQGVQQ